MSEKVHKLMMLGRAACGIHTNGRRFSRNWRFVTCESCLKSGGMTRCAVKSRDQLELFVENGGSFNRELD